MSLSRPKNWQEGDPMSIIGVPNGCVPLVRSIFKRTQSFPKTAGIMLKEYDTKIILWTWNKHTNIWEHM